LFFEIGCFGVQDTVLDIMAPGAAHGEEGVSLQVKDLPAHQMDYMRPDSLDRSTVPFLCRVFAQQVEVFMVAADEQRGKGQILQPVQVPLLLPHHLGKGEDELPRAGEGQCWLPVQQGAAVVLLQAVDVVAEGLLGDIQPLGRPGHVQVLGQLLKIVETDEIHGKPPCPATKFLCRKMKKSLFDF